MPASETHTHFSDRRDAAGAGLVYQLLESSGAGETRQSHPDDGHRDGAPFGVPEREQRPLHPLARFQGEVLAHLPRGQGCAGLVAADLPGDASQAHA